MPPPYMYTPPSLKYVKVKRINLKGVRSQYDQTPFKFIRVISIYFFLFHHPHVSTTTTTTTTAPPHHHHTHIHPAVLKYVKVKRINLKGVRSQCDQTPFKFTRVISIYFFLFHHPHMSTTTTTTTTTTLSRSPPEFFIPKNSRPSFLFSTPLEYNICIYIRTCI